MRRFRRAAALALVVAIFAGCGGDGDDTPGNPKELLLVVNAPFSGAPYVADAITHGVELAVQSAGERGVFVAGDHTYRLTIRQLDNELSPRQALRNVRRAIDEHAIAVIDEGTGVDASWSAARDADLPIGIVYQGGLGLVDEQARPNVFRIAPTDRGIGYRLGEYLVPKRRRVALMYDDSAYGAQGRLALEKAFALDRELVAASVVLPTGQPDLSPQVLRAKRAGAEAVVVWARGPVIAAVLSAARSRGWNVPVFAPPAGADPVVRQQLADHPEWVDGLTFASGRMTAEQGPAPFEAFQSAYKDAFGPDFVGVRTRDGKRVIQPPEYPMYAYDMARCVIAAVQQVGGAEDRARVLAALGQVTIQGANGDARSFNERNHEGVIDDDVYFARFRDMMFAPVRDDPLSATLPVVSQTA